MNKLLPCLLVLTMALACSDSSNKFPTKIRKDASQKDSGKNPDIGKQKKDSGKNPDIGPRQKDAGKKPDIGPLLDLPIQDLPIPDLPTPDLQVPDLMPPDFPIPDKGPICGNGKIETGEQCDGASLGSNSCFLSGWASGKIACTPNTCKLDTSGCYTCNDGKISKAEDCDGTDLDKQTCPSQGYKLGVLKCDSKTCKFDKSNCSTCGDSKVTGIEKCDGTNLNGKTCATAGMTAGTLKCGAATCIFDTSGCSKCGDGKITLKEQCDGIKFNGKTCATYGFGAGALKCNPATCAIDTSVCPPFPVTTLKVGKHATVQTGSMSAAGFYFTAPADITIVSVRVPPEVGTHTQFVNVVRFTSSLPPWNGTNWFTNKYVSLLVKSAMGTGWMSANIAVKKGQLIGIIGGRDKGTILSYPYLSHASTSSIATTMKGKAVTLKNLYAKYKLSRTNTNWYRQGGSWGMGRVEVKYK